MQLLNGSKNRLNAFWIRKLPLHEDQFIRFSKTGLLPQDFNLSDLEIICALSIMSERKTIHEVLQAVDQFRNETTISRFNEAFLEKIQATIEELESKGLRSHARNLTKLGHGIARMQNQSSWETHWSGELDKKRISAIKDEPFLPQKG